MAGHMLEGKRFSILYHTIMHYKYSGKTDPSEIERASNIRKQQTRLY